MIGGNASVDHKIFVATLFDMAGRPPKDPEERKENVLRIRLTAEERAVIDNAACCGGCDTSTWAREKLLSSAKRCKKKTGRAQ